MYLARAKRQLPSKALNDTVISLLKQKLIEQQTFSFTQQTPELSYLPEGKTTLNSLVPPIITKEQVTLLVHEMRSPLSVILNVLSTCQKNQLSKLDQERLTLAWEEAERLRRMADAILTQVRNASKPTFNWQDVKLRDLINEVVYLTTELPVAIDRQITLVSSPPNVTLRGDRDKLKQVFLNLLANACEAAHAGQMIIINCQIEYNTYQVSIKIHNNGTPIPIQLLPLLGHQPVTTKPSGNGLGLMIVKEIITAHGGEFDVESSRLRGTTTQVSLPIIPNQTVKHK